MDYRHTCIGSPMTRPRTLLITFALALGLLGPAQGAHRKPPPAMKTAILLVTFGTSSPQARGAFDNIDRLTRERFPDTEIRWAYTSAFIRRKLARQGETIESPVAALARLREGGYTHVAVQSLHVAAGAEYHDLAKQVSMFRSGPSAFTQIALGRPLILRHDDLTRTVSALLADIPPRQAGEAVVLMGHGNATGRTDMAYLATAAAFQQAEESAFLGTVEGVPTLNHLLEQLGQHKPTRAYLVPFMTVAGEHARKDLAGDDAASWKSQISALGIECVPVLKGMAEIDDIVAVWIDHLAIAVQRLTTPD